MCRADSESRCRCPAEKMPGGFGDWVWGVSPLDLRACMRFEKAMPFISLTSHE